MFKPVDLPALRAYVLESIAIARVHPIHFPACFLRLAIDEADRVAARVTMPYGFPNIDADGCVNVAALAILADIGLSVAMRQHVGHTERLATAMLTLHFNGEPIDGDVAIRSRYEGPVSGLRAPQGLCHGELFVGNRLVGQASGVFVIAPVPEGIKLKRFGPGKLGRDMPIVTLDDLSADERHIYESTQRAARAVNSAANKARAQPRSFIQEFWEQRARRSATGRVGSSVAHGPHSRNRVGHLQGGVLFGAAAAAALAQVAATSRLTSATAWFLRPGRGALKAKSSFLQEGRNIAVVRTEVTGAQGEAVLEMVSTHARKSGTAGQAA